VSNVCQPLINGGFGLTPLHLAAALFKRRAAAAAAEADLEAARRRIAALHTTVGRCRLTPG
jgi:hypothetical protein